VTRAQLHAHEPRARLLVHCREATLALLTCGSLFCCLSGVSAGKPAGSGGASAGHSARITIREIGANYVGKPPYRGLLTKQARFVR
jgi:hypothetical protein